MGHAERARLAVESEAFPAGHRNPAFLPRRCRGALGDLRQARGRRSRGLQALARAAAGSRTAQDPAGGGVDHRLLRPDRARRLPDRGAAAGVCVYPAARQGKLALHHHLHRRGLGVLLRPLRPAPASALPRRMALLRLRRLLAALVALCAFAGAAQAQYPSRPIRVLIPQPPGGANDNVARLFAPGLGDALGQPIVVENRPGANGNLAMELAAKAPADGYTLLLAADAQIVINPHFYSHLPFDTLKDLAPIASLVNTQMVLAVNPALPVRNLQEFIDYA